MSEHQVNVTVPTAASPAAAEIWRHFCADAVTSTVVRLLRPSLSSNDRPVHGRRSSLPEFRDVARRQPAAPPPPPPVGHVTSATEQL